MKKLLTLILLALVFASCSKDDDDKTDNTFIDKDLINVQWKISQGGEHGIWIFSEKQKVGYAITSELDSTMVKIGNGTFDYTTTTDGKLTMNGKTYTYKIDGDNLVVIGNNTSRVFKRVEGYTIVE